MAIVTRRPRKRLSPKAPRRARARIRARPSGASRPRGRSSRRRIDRIHRRLPALAGPRRPPLAPAFTPGPPYRRFVLLVLAAILTVGAHAYRRQPAPHPRRARPGRIQQLSPSSPAISWSPWDLATAGRDRRMARLAPGVVELAADDTVTEARARRSTQRGCHRDPVRSSHSFTAYRWGQKWVALVVLVKVPWARRRWTLPLLLALYRPKGQVRRHKTPAQRARQMLRVLMRWFPDRRFTCSGDGAYASHEFAGLAAAPRAADGRQPVPPPGQPGSPAAGLGQQPPARSRRTCPARPTWSPAWRPCRGRWYGGGRRHVELVSGVGLWYRHGERLIAVRWVFVRWTKRTHRDELLPDRSAMEPEAVIAATPAGGTSGPLPNCGRSSTWRRRRATPAGPCCGPAGLFEQPHGRGAILSRPAGAVAAGARVGLAGEA